MLGANNQWLQGQGLTPLTDEQLMNFGLMGGTGKVMPFISKEQKWTNFLNDLGNSLSNINTPMDMMERFNTKAFVANKFPDKVKELLFRHGDDSPQMNSLIDEWLPNYRNVEANDAAQVTRNDWFHKPENWTNYNARNKYKDFFSE